MTPALMPAVAMTSDPSDRGAHFYCCDFQVHSPRDLNWTGQRPATDQERNAYAADFVRAARKKGLDAVAITDHHDLAFFPYIRAAASQLAPEVGALVVFPGVELTLGKVACQAILLFDPDLDRDALERILPTLGIEPSEQAAVTTAPVTRLPLDLNEVHERLNQLQSLRGRFILLPNVNGGGEDTLLRHGFQEHYKSMPCVGGYVDGAVTNHARRLIIDGQDTNWSSKRIGVIQTSDTRDAEFQCLGSAPTWIKWSGCRSTAFRHWAPPRAPVRTKVRIVAAGGSTNARRPFTGFAPR